MADAPNPLEHAEVWDRVKIAGRDFPFLAKVDGFSRKYDWDKKKGKGALGATTTFTGQGPSEGSVTFFFWEPAHFIDWNFYIKLLKYDPTKKTASAVDIYHPITALNDVKSVVTQEIGPVTKESNLMYSIKVDFLEYKPPPKKSSVSNPKGAKASGGGKTPGATADPVGDAKDAEIKKLLGEAKKPL